MAAQPTVPRNPRILCTEDDADTREILCLLLEAEGFEAVCVEDSAHALRLARAEKFDLYLLDSWLPDLDGDVLCQKLRQFDSTTPILFYSGATEEADRERAMGAGAQGYVVKPADLDQLTAEIGRLLSPPYLSTQFPYITVETGVRCLNC